MDTIWGFNSENGAAARLTENGLEGLPVLLRTYTDDRGRVVREEWGIQMPENGHVTVDRGERGRRGMARVLTRSEGQEIHCIAIEPDGEYVRVLRLILDWSVPLEGSRYVVNGERWRPVNPANRWEGESQSFDEAVAYYKCKDPWPDDPPA